MKSTIQRYKPAKAVLSVEVCARVEEKIETFQVSARADRFMGRWTVIVSAVNPMCQ